MIYTLTLNPSLDYIMECPAVTLGETNRSSREAVRFGGKGINVAAVLSSLGKEVLAVTLLGGETGMLLARLLKEKGIPYEALPIRESARINVKILSHGVTELNARGPAISIDEWEGALRYFDKITEKDTLLLSGSIPSSLPADIYARFMERGRGRVILDTSGEALRAALPYRPYLVKPNESELREVLGMPEGEVLDAERGAKALLEMGARNVLVSLGEKGALLVCEDGTVLRRPAPKGDAKNTVGAGDAMLAGFLYGEEKGWAAALRYAVAAGSATAFGGALASREQIEALAAQI